MKQHNKLRKSQTLFGLGFTEMILWLTGVFLANHLASTDNLARTTKTQNTHTNTTVLDKQQHTHKKPTKLRNHS